MESELDADSMLFPNDEPAGVDKLHYKVYIKSSASEEEIMQIIEDIDQHSPVLDDFRRAIPVERSNHQNFKREFMKAELQRRVQRYGWDKAAPYYETGWQQQLWPAQEELLDKTAIRPGEDILDISCGTGLVTYPMAKAAGVEGSITAIDLSEGMIEKAKELKDERSNDNISFKQMDAEELDFPNKSFDVAVNSLGLMYYPNRNKAIREMFRVLEPGGRASALVWGRRSECGWSELFPIVDCRVKTDVCPLFFQPGTGDNLSNTFRQVGFTAITSDRFKIPLRFKTDEEAVIGAFLGGAVALAYRKFDNETKEEAHKEYIESIQPYRNEDGYEIPGEFVIVTGLKPKG